MADVNFTFSTYQPTIISRSLPGTSGAVDGISQGTENTGQDVLGDRPSQEVVETIVTLDVTESESIGLSSTITSLPVERGSDLNDNIVTNPIPVTITGLVTDTPVVSGPTGLAVTPDFEAFSALSGNESRRAKAYKALKQAWQDSVIVTVTTQFETFENMAISGVPILLTADDDGSLPISVTFQQLNFVESETGLVESAPDGASGTQDKGKKDPKKPKAEDAASGDEVESTSKSTLLKFYNAVAG